MINFIAPVFLIILLGWGLAKYNFIPAQTSKGLMSYIYWVAAPAIIFSAISQYHLPTFFNLKFWAAYTVLFVAITSVAYVHFKSSTGATNRLALTLAYSTTVKNTVTIGMPLLLGILGNFATIPVVITILFVNCFAMPVFVFLIESNNKKLNKLSVIYRTLKNPLVLASLIGLLFAAFQINIPFVINSTLGHLGASFMPCALFAVGTDLRSYTFKNNFNKLAPAIGLNLIAAPLFAILLCFVFHLPTNYAIALVVLSATPTAQLMYAYASQYSDVEQDAAAIVSTTTIFSLITMPVFIYVCYLIWPFALA